MPSLKTAMRNAGIETLIVSASPPVGADKWELNAYHYRVAFTIKGLCASNDRSIVVPFSTGKGWEREPSPAEVMRCVLSEAMDVHPDYGDYRFVDWAENFGYDTDSRKAEEIFKRCQEQAFEFEHLLTRSVAESWYADTELLDSEATDAPKGRAIKRINKKVS